MSNAENIAGLCSMNISVIICTHNPRPDFLRRTLDSLKGQTLPLERWELLLIDNASKERLADTWDLSWHPNGRHVREEQLGLTPARMRGIAESLSQLLVFVDDDNVLAPDYLERVLQIAEKHPNLGVFGAGVLEPEFEAQPSPKVVPFLPRLALRTVDSARWSSNITDDGIFPWGAGLAATRSVALHCTEILNRFKISSILDRHGTQLFSGGDDVFSWAAVGIGREFGIFPELKIRHLMPAGRVRPDYILRLLHDSAFSCSVRVFLLFGTKPNAIGPLSVVPVLVKVRNGIFSMRCAWAERRGVAQAARFLAREKLSSLGMCGIQDSKAET
jgi:glycosyltransferase involved in cell wall biosynthesis